MNIFKFFFSKRPYVIYSEESHDNQFKSMIDVSQLQAEKRINIIKEITPEILDWWILHERDQDEDSLNIETRAYYYGKCISISSYSYYVLNEYNKYNKYLVEEENKKILMKIYREKYEKWLQTFIMGEKEVN